MTRATVALLVSVSVGRAVNGGGVCWSTHSMCVTNPLLSEILGSLFQVYLPIYFLWFLLRSNWLTRCVCDMPDIYTIQVSSFLSISASIRQLGCARPARVHEMGVKVRSCLWWRPISHYYLRRISRRWLCGIPPCGTAIVRPKCTGIVDNTVVQSEYDGVGELGSTLEFSEHVLR